MNIKNILRIIMIFIAIMTVMIQASIASTTGTINYDTVRVRKDPEPDLKKTKTYALVSIGDKVEVLEKTGDWYKITCTYEGKQVTGYVREDLIDIKNPEDVPIINTSDDDDDSNNSSNNNNNSNSNSNSNSNNSNSNSNSNSNTEKPNETNNNNSNSATEKPSTSSSNNSSENPSEEKPDNQTEQPSNTNETAQNQSETTLTTVKVAQNEIKEGNKIKLEKDTHIKILPVVNSTNIGTITSGTDVTVVEIVNKWIRIETEELIGWARIE